MAGPTLPRLLCKVPQHIQRTLINVPDQHRGAVAARVVEQGAGEEIEEEGATSSPSPGMKAGENSMSDQAEKEDELATVANLAIVGVTGGVGSQFPNM